MSDSLDSSDRPSEDIQFLESDDSKGTSTSQDARPPGRPRHQPPNPTGLLIKVVFLIGLFLALQYVLPHILERCQYALTRGQRRAEYEMSATALRDLPLDQLSNAYQMVSEHVGPSVVHIEVRSVSEEPLPRDLAMLLGPQLRESHGQGSGVIVDEAGYIVTNYHVVHGALELHVSLSDGRVVPAVIQGFDTLTDLAVLKVNADNLLPAEWGDSRRQQPGAMVWAVGSPFGLQHTTTFGILSGKHRAGMAGGDVYRDFLQTDAAVNPGNSGGPLVDVRGRVIGINTAIIGEAYQGVSFAIPSSIAQPVYERLKSTGHVARGWLGAYLGDVTDEDVQGLGLANRSGAFVEAVIDDGVTPSPASSAGLKARDVVIRWNGEPVSKAAELIRMVAMTEVGSTATMVVIRGGQEVTLTVQVGERPAEANPR